MFAPVYQAYRGQILFAAASVAYAAVSVVSVIASDTWLGLCSGPIAGALLFAAIRPLRPFASLLLLCVVGSFLIVGGSELLFRARYFGPAAVLDFRDYSPLPPTMIPGFVTASVDPELGYVFTPGAIASINGHRWEINEHGFRDHAFRLEKPQGTYRILVLGDSFALGAGVAREERFSTRLEEMLNGRGEATRYEVYNAALAGLDLPQMEHLMRTYGPRYAMDLVIVALRASQVHEREDEDASAVSRDFMERRRRIVDAFSGPRRYSFILNMYREPVKAGLARVVSIATSGFAKRSGKATSNEALFDSFVEVCAAFEKGTGIPVVMVALRKMEFASDQGLRATLANRALSGDASRRRDHEEMRRVSGRLGVSFVDTYDSFAADARRSDYIVFPGDGHPNARGHQLYADAIEAWLIGDGASPLPGGARPAADRTGDAP